MFKNLYLFSALLAAACCTQHPLEAHCQMPCGIYHDDMIYDQIDQYVETMVKAVSKIKESKLETPFEKNELVRWVMTKDRLSDDISHVICTYFLQQKIKPGEKDSTKQLESAHRLLFGIVAIKQTVDFKAVSDFGEEWEKFKLMFHIENYECKINAINREKLIKKQKAYQKAEAAKEARAKAANGTETNAKVVNAPEAKAKEGAKQAPSSVKS